MHARMALLNRKLNSPTPHPHRGAVRIRIPRSLFGVFKTLVAATQDTLVRFRLCCERVSIPSIKEDSVAFGLGGEEGQRFRFVAARRLELMCVY